MRALVTTGHGGLEGLEFRTDWPDPEPGAREVLVAVGACGLNNTDINTRVGWYAKPRAPRSRGPARRCRFRGSRAPKQQVGNLVADIAGSRPHA